MPGERERERLNDLSEDADAALHADLGQEQIVGQKPLLESAELHQPSEERRLLELKIPGDHQSGDPASLSRRRQVLRQALQRPPRLLQNQQRLRPVLPSRIVRSAALTVMIISSSSAAAAAATGRSVSVIASSTAAAGGRRD